MCDRAKKSKRERERERERERQVYIENQIRKRKCN